MEEKGNLMGGVREEVERLLDQKTVQAEGDRLLDIYEDLLGAIWASTLPILGNVTVMVIVERALVLTGESYAFLRRLQVNEKGVLLGPLREPVLSNETRNLRNGLKGFVVNIADILTALTGDVLVRQVMNEVRRAGKK